MNWKKKMAQYMFYFGHTTQMEIDIDCDIADFMFYTSSFEDMDFEKWVVEYNLHDEYKDYMDRAGYRV